MFVKPFSSFGFRRRSNLISDGEGELHVSTGDWLRHPLSSRRTSETPEQKVTRLVRACLETDDFTDVMAFTAQEAHTASQIIPEMLEPSPSENSSPNTMPISARNKLRVLLWKLVLKNDNLPDHMFLPEVRCTDNESRFSGGFADIFCGEHRGERVALKRLRYYTKLKEAQKSRQRQACFRESLLWGTLDHKHVLSFLGISIDAFEHTPCIVLPWVKNGNILQFMDVLKVQGKFSGPELITTVNQWLYEISQGAAYLHGEGIVHGDLRGINILIDADGIACITNFDLAITTDTGPIDDQSQSFYRETLIWSTLVHKNILPFLGVDSTNFKNSLCMILPWMEHGNIRDCITELKGNNRFHNGIIHVTTWLTQIAEGLAFLHSKSYVHGDLRAANILIDGDLNPSTGSYRSSSNGAIQWLAPELLDPEQFGCESSRPTYAGDVYAFGCVSLEVHTCQNPFQGLTEYIVARRVVEGSRPARPVYADGALGMSDSIWDLCRRCWVANAEERPNADQLVEDTRRELENIGISNGHGHSDGNGSGSGSGSD